MFPVAYIPPVKTTAEQQKSQRRETVRDRKVEPKKRPGRDEDQSRREEAEGGISRYA